MKHVPTPEEDIATCVINLKGARQKQLMETAAALDRLKRLPEYRSNAVLGRTVGVSGEIVREFLTLHDLPLDIRQRFEAGKLGLEHGRRLWQYARSIRQDNHIDWKQVRQVADVMETMTALDSRELVKYLRNHPNVQPEDARTLILASHTQINPLFHVVAVLPRDDFEHLRRIAGRRRASIDGLVTDIILNWLHDLSKADTDVRL